jgi:ABC-type branched-subunit amino acid transport system permease subunit
MKALDRKWVWIWGALLPGRPAACPSWFKNYRVFQFNLVLVYAIAVLGLNILTGFNGQISLGHGAFYAIGAYVAAILMDRWACRTGPRCRWRPSSLLRLRLPDGVPGAAAGGHLPGAGHLRAGAGGAAAAEVQAHRAPGPAACRASC